VSSSLDSIKFETFIALAIIYSTYPVRYKDLKEFFPWNENILKKESLTYLFDNRMLEEKEKKYIPTKNIEELPIPDNLKDDLARVRGMLMNKRLADDENITDYRLIL
jgi:hypothetical protein